MATDSATSLKLYPRPADAPRQETIRVPAGKSPAFTAGTKSGVAGSTLIFAADAVVLGLFVTAAIALEVALYGTWSIALVGPIGALAVGLLLAFLDGRVYASVRRHPVAEFRNTCLSIIGMGTAAAAASITAADWHLSATLLILGVCFCLMFAIPVTRYISRHSAAKLKIWGRRVVIVGGGENGVRLFQHLKRRPHFGLRPVGILEDLDELSLDAEPASYLGPVSELPRVAAEHGVSLGVLISHEAAGQTFDLLHQGAVLPDWLLLAGPPSGPSVWPGLWVESRELGGMPSLSVRNHLRMASAQRLKRAMDLVLTIGGGICLLPLFALIALVMKLTSPGPIFYSQARTGHNGKRFRAWKFRSMRVDAEDVLRKYLDEHPELQAEWNAIRKLKNDPRVTPLGKLLRKTSLDELPQLWNVLIGEMSLVGPRPLPDTDLDKYDQLDVYTKALPGITGLWQVSGRSNTTFEERVAYDAFYVRNWSPWFDLYILACTIRVVLVGEGAY